MGLPEYASETGSVDEVTDEKKKVDEKVEVV